MLQLEVQQRSLSLSQSYSQQLQHQTNVRKVLIGEVREMHFQGPLNLVKPQSRISLQWLAVLKPKILQSKFSQSKKSCMFWDKCQSIEHCGKSKFESCPFHRILWPVTISERFEFRSRNLLILRILKHVFKAFRVL